MRVIRRRLGVVRFEVLALKWSPQPLHDRVAAEHKSLREKLQPMLGSPFGEGLHRLL